MTYFRVKGKTLTKACNRNKRLMAEAKRIYFSCGVDEAVRYVIENTKKTFRTKKLHKKVENLRERRKNLGVSATLMAKTMGYSNSFYRAAEQNKCNYSEVFYKKFEKSEKKLKKLLTTK